MKYYKIKKTRGWIEYKKTFPRASPYFSKEKHLIEAKKIYLDNYIDERTEINDFILWSNDNIIDDWILLDCYGFSNTTLLEFLIKGFYISKKLKSILNNFKIAPPFRFYPSTLNFKDEKFEYFIFQLARPNFEGFDYQASSYYIKDENGLTLYDGLITNRKEFFQFFKSLAPVKRIQDSQGRFRLVKSTKSPFVNLVMDVNYDIFYFPETGIVASERTKIEIEKNNISGIELEEIKGFSFEFKQHI